MSERYVAIHMDSRWSVWDNQTQRVVCFSFDSEPDAEARMRAAAHELNYEEACGRERP